MNNVLPQQSAEHTNNFDLIRLFAALQVAAVHCATHLNAKGPWLEVFSLFPGVPVFFFISGFLIFQSWSNIRQNRVFIFFTNRSLRIFPALYFCVGLSSISLYLSGYLSISELIQPQFWIWVLSQITAFQFFNPEFLRGYGVGVVNGSLWTIAVELQFYFLTPLLFILISKGKCSFFAVFLLFCGLNLINTYFNPGLTILHKLFSVSFLPWFAMFMLGAYVSTAPKLRSRILEAPWVLLIGAYVSVHFIAVWGGQIMEMGLIRFRISSL